MPESEHFPGPAAAFVKQGKEETIPQSRAGIQDRLHLSGGQDPRQLLRGLQRGRPPAIWLFPSCWIGKMVPAPSPPPPPHCQYVSHLGARALLARPGPPVGRETS